MKFVSTPFGRVEISKTADKRRYKMSKAAKAKFEHHFGNIVIYHYDDGDFKHLLVWNANYEFTDKNGMKAILARYAVEVVTHLMPMLCPVCESKTVEFPRKTPDGPCTCEGGCHHSDPNKHLREVAEKRDSKGAAFYQP